MTFPCVTFDSPGQIAAICSLAGLMPSPGQAAYSMSKHALLGWFHSLAAELADTAIKFTLVCPGVWRRRWKSNDRCRFGGREEKKKKKKMLDPPTDHALV